MNLKENVKSIIEKYIDEDSSVIVLKGIDITMYYENLVVDMDELLNNKMAYFMKIYANNRRVITYDEYIALYDLVLLQYKKIIIIDNNLYINFYPLQVKLSDQVLNALLAHFDEDREGDKFEIGDLTDITSVYANVIAINNRYYVSYNNTAANEKEIKVDLFEKSLEPITREIITNVDLCLNIIDEYDYIAMLDRISYDVPEALYILEKNTSINKILLEEKLHVIKTVYENLNVAIALAPETRESADVRSEFTNILKTYWGYDTFKKIKVYNMNELYNGSKVVEEVTQGEIIANIVNEAEKCMDKKDYRDIFVTAPTGAGKSAMFQIPAIYLAEKYQLFTIVISPLIGLMKDQVNNLELRNYNYARTINSDISPIQKQEILNDIADYKCHILYISPESLLSKSDLDQIIGYRTLGLMVIDEAHIVTTWGKQFRPDYWYLGDHLNKIKKAQLKKKGMGFVVATFTATAIFGGVENMYEETIQSLKMIDPITYLGYVKRDDIIINIEPTETIRRTTEYELEKFNQLLEKIDYAIMLGKKMLIYFPTVALIERFYQYCSVKNLLMYVSKYHGQMTAYQKEESYRKFLNNETPVMLATKAFGMGIDIDDIEIVAHFAPTGNVCDYVQEIGRAARRRDLTGEAFYKFMKNDFKHINRLHGLSVIKEYQLVEVIRKIYELYQESIRNRQERKITKKAHEMLIDAESFSHIFENPFFSEDDGINKVKTAMLLIQKDFERRFAFSPFHVRPIPLFEIGYFKIDLSTQNEIRKKYGSVLQEVDEIMHVCSVNLKKIWEQGFDSKFSFPKFKYMLYTKDADLMFQFKDAMKPALCVDVVFEENYLKKYDEYFTALKTIVNRSIRNEQYYSIDGEDGLVSALMKEIKINIYKSKSIIETLISAMSVYQRDYSRNIHGKIYVPKPLKSGDVKYKFTNGATSFFRWVENGFNKIRDNIKEGRIYLVEKDGNQTFKEILLILGILETLDILVFKALGGKNSQIYIYVNQTKTMREILDKPWRYKNRLLELVAERHRISVEMLTYIFESNFSNDEIWNLIEDYFLGVIPDIVVERYKKAIGGSLEN
ncbi:MAG TPA: ATP-dependent DNA helicase RecQ [Clostridiales bacterium]|nr:ATP-dependent DNA helicase RecQ [Clostridiales bacterium]